MTGDYLRGNPGTLLVTGIIGIERLVLQLWSRFLRLGLTVGIQLRAHYRLNDLRVVVKRLAMANEMEAVGRCCDATVFVGEFRHLLVPIGGIHCYPVPYCCRRLAASDSRHTVRLRR